MVLGLNLAGNYIAKPSANVTMPGFLICFVSGTLRQFDDFILDIPCAAVGNIHIRISPPR